MVIFVKWNKGYYAFIPHEDKTYKFTNGKWIDHAPRPPPEQSKVHIVSVRWTIAQHINPESLTYK
jgi:hypothetical protein